MKIHTVPFSPTRGYRSYGKSDFYPLAGSSGLLCMKSGYFKCVIIGKRLKRKTFLYKQKLKFLPDV